MDSRELLKHLTALPISTMFINKRAAWFTTRIDRKVVLFLDEDVIPLNIASDMAAAIDKKLSLETIIIPVKVPPGKSIDQIVRVCQAGPHDADVEIDLDIAQQPPPK